MVEELTTLVKELKDEVQMLKEKINNNDDYIQTLALHFVIFSIHKNTTDFLYTYKTIKLANVLKMKDMYLNALRTKYDNPELEYNKLLGYGFVLSLQKLYYFSIRIVDDNGNVIFDGFDTKIKNIFNKACQSCDWSKYPYECLKDLVKAVPNIMFELHVPDTIGGKFGLRVEDYVEMRYLQ